MAKTKEKLWCLNKRSNKLRIYEFNKKKQLLPIMVLITYFGIVFYFFNNQYQFVENFWLSLLWKLIYLFCCFYYIGTLFIHWKNSHFINKKLKWGILIISMPASTVYLIGFLLYYIFVYELKFGIYKEDTQSKMTISINKK